MDQLKKITLINNQPITKFISHYTEETIDSVSESGMNTLHRSSTNAILRNKAQNFAEHQQLCMTQQSKCWSPNVLLDPLKVQDEDLSRTTRALKNKVISDTNILSNDYTFYRQQNNTKKRSNSLYMSSQDSYSVNSDRITDRSLDLTRQHNQTQSNTVGANCPAKPWQSNGPLPCKTSGLRKLSPSMNVASNNTNDKYDIPVYVSKSNNIPVYISKNKKNNNEISDEESDVKEDEKSDVESNVKADEKSDVKANEESDKDSNEKLDVKADEESNEESDVKADEESDVK